jgi:hypothetical protein
VEENRASNGMPPKEVRYMNTVGTMASKTIEEV